MQLVSIFNCCIRSLFRILSQDLLEVTYKVVLSVSMIFIDVQRIQEILDWTSLVGVQNRSFKQCKRKFGQTSGTKTIAKENLQRKQQVRATGCSGFLYTWMLA